MVKPFARFHRLLILAGFVSALSPLARADTGWNPGVDVIIEGAASLNGGNQRGESLHSLALAHLAWEQPEAAKGTLHLSLYASALSLEGRGPTERFLGDFLAASNTEGFNSTRVYSWWLEASLGEWSLRGGALLADEEFAGTKAGGNFFNSTFGWPTFISANTVNTGPAFFAAAPGVRLERRLGETAAWRIGIYDGDTFDSPAGDPSINRHGLHYRLGGSQGWYVMSEVSFAPAAIPARFKFGGWRHTADFADVRVDASGRPFSDTGQPPRNHSGDYGAYGTVEQTLAGKSGEPGSIELFVRGGGAPSDRNTINWAVDSGVSWTGPMPGRPGDVVALGFAHANFSSRYAANARADNPSAPTPDYEEVVEANYRLILSDHFSLQPDLQYIRHPGGSAAQRDALAFLLRLNASY